MLLNRATLISALLFTIANGAFGAIPLFLLPWLTRILSPTEYGLVAMFTIMMQLFSAVTGLSVQGAVGIRYFKRDQIDFPRYVASCLTVLVASTFLVMATVIVTMPVLERLTMLPAAWIVAAIVVSSCQFVIQIQLAIWQSERAASKFAGLRLSQVAIDITASVSLVILLGYAWEGRPIGIMIASLAAALFALHRLSAKGWLRFPASREHMVDALWFGVPLVPHALGGMLIALADRFIITNFLGLAEAGIYTVAVQLGLAVLLLADGMNRAVGPWIFETLKKDDPATQIRVVRVVYAFLAIMAFGGMVAGVISYYLLPLIAGDAFSAAASFMPVIALGYAIGGMYLMMSNFVFYAGATARLAVVTMTAGLLNIGMSYIFVSRLGLQGAPYAFLAAQLLLFAGASLLAIRVSRLPWFGHTQMSA
ncbi:oligosaccharide flippase family protein [Rhodopseudomonas palustris]|uniref:Oligosaccharide flippase family protein n=1 Tax=Rhodopseudomonas palustris TaxID=1076 RepID=A0AAX3E0K0_RHOPL|nr:oligosaccharide flippase family protein [Rhodopseudomonas palustris]UYO40508.1 oligosaccharide flippase family protein [Rhodopseudomonas palustris]